MVKTINMQDMRYLNLFGKITKVNTHFCFKYNNTLMFGVPRPLVTKSLGQEGRNIRKVNHILGKRVKVIALPSGSGEKEIKIFIQNIVSPVTFRDLEIKDGEVVLTAGSRNKAALIGRNKRRLHEMQKIVKDYFGKEFRVI